MSEVTLAPHPYTARIEWIGNLGVGTSSYGAYSRQHRISFIGKPALAGSADRAYRGDAELYNPEDLFLASLSACHMLFFLSLCARHGVRVISYVDEAHGSIEVQPGGGGRFAGITLRPVVTVGDPASAPRALDLHRTAHQRCFIANSCSTPVRIDPTIRVPGDGGTDPHRSVHLHEEG
jgi:organic hydroperoxide reductase OsmC/OhrA